MNHHTMHNWYRWGAMLLFAAVIIIVVPLLVAPK